MLRASLFLVAGLALAACSSAIPSSSANPQTPNLSHRSPLGSLSDDHITLQFENIAPDSDLHVNVVNSWCIGSVTPDKIHLRDRETATVDIKGESQGDCKEFNALMFSVDFRGSPYGPLRLWFGELAVGRLLPQPWTGQLLGAGYPNLCTDPPGFAERTELHDKELIKFYFCGPRAPRAPARAIRHDSV